MPKQIQLIAYEIDTRDTAKIHSILSAQGAHPCEASAGEYVMLQANECGEAATGRSTAAATRAHRRKPSFVAVTLTLALAVLARDASANTEAERKRMRQLIDAAMFVVTGGGRLESTYKWSDEGDRARTIAKNSMLADTTYQNRVILTDIFYKDYKDFIADLQAVGHTEQAGSVMLSGYDYDLNSRIPLAIPSTAQHTCKGACAQAAQLCANKKNKPIEQNGIYTDEVRRCVYTVFRLDLFNTLAQIAEGFGQNGRGTWDAVLDPDHREYDKWLQLRSELGHIFNWTVAPRDSVQRAVVIALGTPVSFYSHNPLKPVGYHYDTKNKNKGLICSDTFDKNTLQLVHPRGGGKCSDFDIKIYWPDMVYDYMQKVLASRTSAPGSVAFDAQIKNGEITKSPSPEAVKFLRDNLPINFKIVDGGKQHVLRNVAEEGRGVYQQYQPLAEFVTRWTEAFGREVDVKLELSVSTPIYLAIPGGPIAIYDAKHSPSAVIDVDDEVNNESRITENLDEGDQ